MKSLHINQDNDWATAPPTEDQTEKMLWEAYVRKIAELQVQIHSARNTQMDTKLDRYFHSSQIKNTLARVLCLSSYDSKPVSITEISKQIYASRQATLGMLNDCVAESWAVLTTGKPNTYTASKTLIHAFEVYCVFHYDLCNKIGVEITHNTLSHYYRFLDKVNSTK